jgi:hypothetical protein
MPLIFCLTAVLSSHRQFVKVAPGSYARAPGSRGSWAPIPKLRALGDLIDYTDIINYTDIIDYTDIINYTEIINCTNLNTNTIINLSTVAEGCRVLLQNQKTVEYCCKIRKL